MDTIENVYKQVRAWKKTEEERAREAEIERAKKVREAWLKAREPILELFPVEGIMIYEAKRSQMEDFPHQGNVYFFDVVLPGSKYDPASTRGKAMKGVIRVEMVVVASFVFKPVFFYTWDRTGKQPHDNHRDAFLAACEALGVGAES